MARKRIINEKSTETLYKIGLDKNGNKNWKSKIVFNALLHLDKTKYYEIYEMQMFLLQISWYSSDKSATYS